MNEAFLFIFRFLGINGDGVDGEVHTTTELIEQMRANPDYRAEQKAFQEHVWKTNNLPRTEALIQMFMTSARYLSDLIGGDVPILAPRDIVEAGVGVHRPPSNDALLIGKAMQRAIQGQLDTGTKKISEMILTKIGKIMDANHDGFITPNMKYLNTRQIGQQLGLAAKTVRKLCNNGDIVTKKLAGGE